MNISNHIMRGGWEACKEVGRAIQRQQDVVKVEQDKMVEERLRGRCRSCRLFVEGLRAKEL